ncbi:hypothetical protein HFN01_00760 [Rhizobium leguminosarum]|nr:aconitase family protein [Rhizobium leguminosarum]MBY5393354.1 hypothetical protein [Rhizobium leguminosarum]
MDTSCRTHVITEIHLCRPGGPPPPRPPLPSLPRSRRRAGLQRSAALQPKPSGDTVLSRNRNFPGRVHPQLEAGYLASPPVVVAFAPALTDDHCDMDLFTVGVQTP